MMAKNQDELNANDLLDSENGTSVAASISENPEAPPKSDNPFSFKHFLRRDPTTSSSINHSQSNTNIVNGNDLTSSTVNGSPSSSSPSQSATSSSLNSTGARPKVPQFQADPTKMKRSPKFSSFDSQSSLSELAADERMHGSRSNNSFNMDYQFPSSRSYSNYDIEPTSSVLDRKQQHPSGVRSFAQRSQSIVNNTSNTMLPDFVQDHLLMEYYNNSNNSPTANRSPDEFNVGNCDSLNHQNSPKNNPFDLTFNRSPNNRRRANNSTIPLDLPLIDRSRRSPKDFPPDLMDNASSSNVSVQREETYGPDNQPEITRDQAAVDKMQTLPDFLSDGLIHSSNRLADVATISHDEDNQSLMCRLQQDNDRLRMDLEESRSIIIDMEVQINHAKNLETQYNVTLAESMEQVEENLFASNQRAAEAQSLANKYKQQVKQLTSEIQLLKRENETFREGGAVGGVGAANSSRNRHLARDLRMAASTAENNLRQLLSGVENLRVIANTMENLDQPTSNAANLDYLSDSDENDFTEGPAL